MIIQNESAWAFPSMMPIVPGHILISPLRHATLFEELTHQEITEIFNLMNVIKNALKKTFHAEGFNHAWNEGKIAGQSIPHFHLHIVPRKEGDTGIWKYEPRDFLYRPGERALTPENELIEISQLIQKAL